MKIAEFARRTGVPVDTARDDERDGLPPEPARRASGYRAYTPDDVARLDVVRRAKALGFTLAEVRELAALLRDRATDASNLRTLAHARLAHIDDRLAELSRLRDALRTVVDAWPGRGPLDACPIRAAVAPDAVR